MEIGSVLVSPSLGRKCPLFRSSCQQHPSRIEQSAFLRAQPVETGQLRRRRRHVVAVRTLGRGRVLQAGRGVPVVATVHRALLHQLPFGFLLPPPLLLPQQLLGLQEDSSVDGAAARVAVPGALVAGVPGVVLGRLEDLTGRVGLIPRVLGDGAGVFPGLTRLERGNGCVV